MIFFILLVITNICISYADPTVSQQITEPTPSRALLQKLESQPQDITLRNKVAKQLYSEKQYSKVIEILSKKSVKLNLISKRCALIDITR